MANPLPASCPFDPPKTLAERTRQWSVFQPWLQQDPISFWNEMREESPIARSEEYATRLFSAAGMPQSQARILIAAASCATAGGLADEEASLLLLAGELARRCGATAIEIQAERVQRQPAPRWPQPDALWSNLTTREREIAELAGTGKRTRNIATELSLSPRTVDVHLTRIYRKLNISSRTALARLVVESQSCSG